MTRDRPSAPDLHEPAPAKRPGPPPPAATVVPVPELPLPSSTHSLLLSRAGFVLRAPRHGDATGGELESALLLLRSGDTRGALPRLASALATLERAGEMQRAAQAVLSLGYAHVGAACPDLAERHLADAYTRFDTLGDALGAARVLLVRALGASLTGDAHGAIAHNAEALDLLSTLGAERPVDEWALNNHGVYLAQAGALQDALQYLHESARRAREIRSTAVLVDSLLNLAELRIEQGWLASAASTLDELTERMQVLDDPEIPFELLMRWGRYWRRKGDLVLARAHLERALDASWSTGRAEHMLRAHSALAETFEAQGDAVRALEHSRQVAALRGQVATERAEARLAATTAALRGEVEHARASVEEHVRTHLDRRVEERTAKLASRVAELELEVAERRAAEARIRELAERDPLTGCSNRLVLASHLQRLIDEVGDADRVAVLFIDLDRFKQINDSLGHDIGDQVLKQVAARLQTCVSAQDILARYGGDEFVHVMRSGGQNIEVIETVNRIRQSFDLPFVAAGQVLYLSCSIGISYFPDHSRLPGDLLRYADLAMYDVKRRGRNAYGLFDRRMTSAAERRLALESDLHGAVDRGELRLYFQPEADLATGSVSGLEVLLRWQHPQRGMVLPSEFIPVAEDTGLIIPIGQWVLEQTCRQFALWRNRLGSEVKFAINLSPRQLASPSLVEMVCERLGNWSLPPAALQLEVTETMLVDLNPTVLRRLAQLREMGVTIALDDFGTGYSSLAYLSRLPIDTLKIDRSFVRGIAEDGRQRALVGSMISMAHALSMNCIAEGVEEPAELDALRELGCDQYQGFLYARPSPAQTLEKLLLH